MLDSSGHRPVLDDPARLEAAVLPFLERLTGTSRTPVAEPG